MKIYLYAVTLLFSSLSFAQKHTPLPHGMVFGIKPNTTAMMDASKTEAYMGKETRISTTIRGKVIKVTNPEGGWFELDAGNGNIIAAHFKNYAINLPTDLQGRTVIIEGVAQKQFIADDLQHLAGDTVTGKKQHHINVDPKRRLTFEVKGLFVDK
ncbi:MAG TPA: DUF4920 domain-containing protein [Mucilaginibacter sp.]